ncbi:MAG: class I SAM-dependent methyltransferase [Candidatus Binatia bacterium]
MQAPADWIATRCAVCGETGGRPLFPIDHRDAPAGRTFLVRCDGCGLRRLDPRPSQDTVARYYAAATGFNAYAGRRRGPAQQALWNALRDGLAAPLGQSVAGRALRPMTRPIARWLFDINVPLEGRTGLRVLEVGSGFGDLLVYLQARGCDVLGTDPSPSAAAKARGYGVEVRVGVLRELALPAAHFDVAVMNHSLEHLPDPNDELAEVARLLTPRGHLHVAVPNGDAVRLRLDEAAWEHLSTPLHYWFFDAGSLTRLLERHGFRLLAPPMTTTRHHALRSWRTAWRRLGVVVATRQLSRFLVASYATRGGGDVLRIVAERRA